MEGPMGCPVPTRGATPRSTSPSSPRCCEARPSTTSVTSSRCTCPREGGPSSLRCRCRCRCSSRRWRPGCSASPASRPTDDLVDGHGARDRDARLPAAEGPGQPVLIPGDRDRAEDRAGRVERQVHAASHLRRSRTQESAVLSAPQCAPPRRGARRRRRRRALGASPRTGAGSRSQRPPRIRAARLRSGIARWRCSSSPPPVGFRR